MAEPLAYIVSGAIMSCDKGVAFMPFKTNKRTTKSDGLIAANESDKTPNKNIPNFVICSVGNVPCVPKPTPAKGGSVWHNTGEDFATIAGLPPVLFRSCIHCSKGGKISFLTTGQIPMADLDPEGKLQQQIEEVNKQAKEMKEEYDNAENAVGESGLVEGFVPVWGSGRDAVNSFQQGKWGWGLFNSAMVVVDVGTLGIGSLVKGAVKGGVKGAVKGAAKGAVKGMAKKIAAIGAAKTALKKAIKEGVKEAIDKAAIKGCRLLLKACFPAGTIIATKNGVKNIEDIKINDFVWSYNPDSSETGLKKVVDTYQGVADSTIHLTIGSEIVETTKNHPFFTIDGWKDAGNLNTNDKVKSKNGNWEQIKAVNYSSISKKVFNFTVKDWHTYFVGSTEWLVHNSCYKRTFFKAFPKLKGKVVVHHAVEQQVLKKYPGLFDDDFIHSLENLRGIPKELNNDLHLSKIRKEWNKFYKRFDGTTPTRLQVLRYKNKIDKMFGHLFNPPL